MGSRRRRTFHRPTPGASASWAGARRSPTPATRCRRTAWAGEPMKLWWPWRRRQAPPQAVTDALQHALAMTLATDHAATFDQMRSNVGWAFAANRQIWGRAIRAEPQLSEVTRTAAGDHDRRPVHDHPVLDLLQQPNPDESGATFHARQVLQLQTAGRCYVAGEPERTTRA